MRFDEYVSLGDNCETAFQLRRATGVDGGHFLDWTRVAPEVVATLIERRFAGILQPDALAFDPATALCVDRAYGHQFHHHFADGARPQDDPRFEERLGNERRRADHLIPRLLQPRGPRCYVMRAQGRLNRIQAVRVRHAVAALHPESDFLLVTVQAEAHRRPHPWRYPNIEERFVSFVADPASADVGDEPGWDAILTEFPLRPQRPANTSSAKVAMAAS
ncbi:MAG TPA: DUF1796 family putative cysteine peptidase [Caulobacteraceae bacterium]